jgi:hypothetical protein
MSRIRRLTRLGVERAPEPVVRAARGVTRFWGYVTAQWRMTPSFVVLGAQRAGTTTLFRVLSEHPDVVRPTQSKGIGYFDVGYAKGRRWYLAHFPLRLPARLLHGPRAQAFESSGYYLFHPSAPERIARDLPGVKVIAIVRDPVERAYSAHRHELARGFETEPFAVAVDLEPGRLAGEVDKIVADPSYESFQHRHHAYLARSRYAEQIQRYVDALGAERVYIVDADELFASPATEIARLFDWLGLSPWQPETVEQWNAQRRESMDPDLRRRLEEYFRPWDERLEEQMGRRPSWRRSPA